MAGVLIGERQWLTTVCVCLCRGCVWTFGHTQMFGCSETPFPRCPPCLIHIIHVTFTSRERNLRDASRDLASKVTQPIMFSNVSLGAKNREYVGKTVQGRS
jgi:hypothetical protein